MSVPGGGSRYHAIPVHDDPPLYPPPTVSASAKGKGKGRALPDEEEQGLSFGIRFTDGQTPDLVDLWVGHRETVRDLKRRVRHPLLSLVLGLGGADRDSHTRAGHRSASSDPTLSSSSKSTPSPAPKPTVDRADSD